MSTRSSAGVVSCVTCRPQLPAIARHMGHPEAPIGWGSHAGARHNPSTNTRSQCCYVGPTLNANLRFEREGQSHTWGNFMIWFIFISTRLTSQQGADLPKGQERASDRFCTVLISVDPQSGLSRVVRYPSSTTSPRNGFSAILIRVDPESGLYRVVRLVPPFTTAGVYPQESGEFHCPLCSPDRWPVGLRFTTLPRQKRSLPIWAEREAE